MCVENCTAHEIFDLEITTSPGNDLGNVAPSEVDLKKKSQVSPLLGALLLRIRVLWHELNLISKKKLCTTQVSRVFMESNVYSKMKRCNTAETH